MQVRDIFNLKMKKLAVTCLWILLLTGYARAQEQPAVRQQADKLFERYEYFKSLGLYLKLANKTEGDAELFERIADCYLNINYYDDAEKWYARTTAYAGAGSVSHYNYAEVLLRNRKFSEAKKQYRLYFTNDAAALKIKLATCDSAAAWIKEKSRYVIKNEAQLNTNYSDWGLNYSGDATIFTSDRRTNEKDIDNRTGNNWFKLYAANGAAIKGIPIVIKDTKTINGKYHIGPMALNAAADTAYITITTNIPAKNLSVEKSDLTSQRLYTRRLQLVVAAKTNGRWTVFGSFAYNDVQNYSVGNAALTRDGSVLYFTSDMPGGEGKTDIWYCRKQADGSWDKPVNCGKVINTKEEEDFATAGINGELYFSSKGLPGMGGFDIFKTKYQNGQWSRPENLKYPVNTTSDDFYLSSKDGLAGYFSSNREGGSGSDDIYSFSYKPADTIPAKLISRIDVPILLKPGSSEQPAPPKFELQTIYYDLDKSNIRPDAVEVMDKLISLLKAHPELKIELSSYTDSRASAGYNLSLSRRRVKAAVDYLVAHGIPQDRLVPKFYGENNLVNKCADNVNCTEAEQQMNRRTEFRVVLGNRF